MPRTWAIPNRCATRPETTSSLRGAASSCGSPRIAVRDKSDEFDIPGTGEPFRGSWIDLINNLYMVSIQEPTPLLGTGFKA